MTSGITSSSASATSSTDTSDYLQKLFARMDTDGDGQVSQDEFTAAIQKRFGTTGGANGAPDAAAIFKSADTDGDGKISMAEFTASFEKMRASGSHHHGGHHAPPATDDSSDSSDSSDTTALASNLFTEIDSNGDGSITLDELKSALTSKSTTAADSTSASDAAKSSDFAKLFSAIDTNGDGKLSSTEFAALIAQMQQKQDANSTYDVNGTSPDSSAAGAVLSAQA